MAQTDSANECEGDQNGDSEASFDDLKTCSTNGGTKSEGAGSGGASSTSRRSRRKQSDPRRLGSEIALVNIVKLNVDKMDISTEPIGDGDDELYGSDAGNEDDVDEHELDDDVFLKVRTKIATPIPDSNIVIGGDKTKGPKRLDPSPLMSKRSENESDASLERDIVDNGDCQPEDLSLGKKKRSHNRVVLAVPSVIRPHTLTKSREFVEDCTSDLANQSRVHQATRSFKTISHDLHNQGSLIALERDYRMKYVQEYDDDYHDPHSDINDQEYHRLPPFTVGHGHKLALDPDCNSNSPDLHCEQSTGKTSPSTSTSSSSSTSPSSKGSKKQQRSYKNLSRSRRIVANARERNRVHTISAAFEGLRRAVPSYSHNQKLSKLAILRIACSYILALAKLADLDYTADDHQQAMSFEDCVELCTSTLQAEGRSKRRKTPME